MMINTADQTLRLDHTARAALSNALRVAAEKYRDNAAVFQAIGNKDLVDTFRHQAEEALQLAGAIDAAEDGQLAGLDPELDVQELAEHFREFWTGGNPGYDADLDRAPLDA